MAELKGERIAEILEQLDLAYAEIMAPENMTGNSMVQRERVFRLGDYLAPRWPKIRDHIARLATLEAALAAADAMAEVCGNWAYTHERQADARRVYRAARARCDD